MRDKPNSVIMHDLANGYGTTYTQNHRGFNNMLSLDGRVKSIPEIAFRAHVNTWNYGPNPFEFMDNF